MSSLGHSADEVELREGMAAEFENNSSNIGSLIGILKTNLSTFMQENDAKRILRMFDVFEEMAKRYALINNGKFTEAFKNYDFVKMIGFLQKISDADDILTEYFNEITEWTSEESSSTDESETTHL